YEGCFQPHSCIAERSIPSGLSHVINILREISFDREINIPTREIDVSIDPRVTNNHDIKAGIHHTQSSPEENKPLTFCLEIINGIYLMLSSAASDRESSMDDSLS